MTYDQCNEYLQHLANQDINDECNPCDLARAYEQADSVGALNGACENDDNNDDPCCENGKKKELTTAMLWEVWKHANGDSDFGPVENFPGTAPWKANDPERYFKFGTSDGTPRTNAHAQICHVEPFAPLQFLIAGGDNPSGLSTFTPGGLALADSFAEMSDAAEFRGGMPADYDHSGAPVFIQRFDYYVGDNHDNVYTKKTFAFRKDPAMAGQHRYGEHTCSDLGNRTHYSSALDFGRRGIVVASSTSGTAPEFTSRCDGVSAFFDATGRRVPKTAGPTPAWAFWQPVRGVGPPVFRLPRKWWVQRPPGRRRRQRSKCLPPGYGDNGPPVPAYS